jgi:hypothetical protein
MGGEGCGEDGGRRVQGSVKEGKEAQESQNKEAAFNPGGLGLQQLCRFTTVL